MKTTRAGLLVLGLPQAATGLWALLAPRGWYDEFPGAGREWIHPFGPYQEHLTRDAGGGLFALGALLVVAAIVLERRAVQVALVAWLLFQVPHFVYHLTALEVLPTVDDVANLVILGIAVILPVPLLVAARGLGTRGPAP